MKKNLFFLIWLVSTLFFSMASYSLPLCALSQPSDSPVFCSSFTTVAQCHCAERLPSGMCQQLQTIYDRMIAVFGSLDGACSHQHDTTKQICIDDWNCAIHGGRNSAGKLCNATGNRC